MSIRIDGTNTTANPGITGGDADTGLQFGTDEISFVTGGTNRATVESNGNFTIENGNLVLASGSGIDFSATGDGSGTVTSELLDEYEEGSWTPTIGRSTGAPTVTYSNQSGKYTKIGNQVLIFFDFTLTSISGGSGRYYIGGLPFSSATDSSTGGYGSPQFRTSSAFNADARVNNTSAFHQHLGSVIELLYINNSFNEANISVSAGRITGWSVYFTDA